MDPETRRHRIREAEQRHGFPPAPLSWIARGLVVFDMMAEQALRVASKLGRTAVDVVGRNNSLPPE